MQESQVQSLCQEDPLEQEMAPTLVFLPGKFRGQRRLVGYSLWGHKESGTTKRQNTHDCITDHSMYYPYKYIQICVFIFQFYFFFHSNPPLFVSINNHLECVEPLVIISDMLIFRVHCYNFDWFSTFQMNGKIQKHIWNAGGWLCLYLETCTLGSLMEAMLSWNLNTASEKPDYL